jgi:uncharacterized membrane protein YdjX (TVP38/TMEM64 family)
VPVKKLLLALVIFSIVALFLSGASDAYLDIRLYQGLYQRSPALTLAVFFLVFLAGTSFSLPVTGLLAVASGALFGMVIGSLISLAALTMGGSVAVIITRYLLHDLVLRRFTGQIAVVNKGVEKEGAFFLFSLRLLPVLPFWLINWLIGLTSMRIGVFMLATFFGMAPVILLLSYTGSQLGAVDSLSLGTLFTPSLLLAFALLAAFPLLARGILFVTRNLAKQSDS